jgi:hypothetical protein
MGAGAAPGLGGAGRRSQHCHRLLIVISADGAIEPATY